MSVKNLSPNQRTISTNLSDSQELFITKKTPIKQEQQCKSERKSSYEEQPKRKVYDSFSSNLEINDQEGFSFYILKKFSQIDDLLTINNIFEKIIYENYTFNDLKQNIFLTLRKIESINDFFEILFQMTKDYTESIIENIEIVEHESEELNQEMQINYVEFKKVSNNLEKYKNIFQIIEIKYQEYLRVCNELYKIINLYIQNFISQKSEVLFLKKINFDTKDFHLKMFNFIVFNEPIIRSFINFMIQQHNTRNFKNKKYRSFNQNLEEFIYFFQQALSILLEEDEFYVQNHENNLIEEQTIIQPQILILKKEKKSQKKKKKEKKIEIIDQIELPQEQKVSKVNFDIELKEFEKRLDQNNKNYDRLKLNISPEWINKLKIQIQKQKKKI